MSRPDCFVAGFYKCGTTSLYCILKQHKSVLVSKEKEPLFFSDQELYKKGIMWYEKTYYNFDKKSKEKIIEINPWLTEVQGTAKRLSYYYGPNTPIAFVVRNPVDFLYSHFKFQIRRGEYSVKEMNFCKKNSYAIAFNYYICEHKREIKQYKHFFSSQLKEYQKYFKNLKIFFLEELQQDGEKFYHEMLDFLELEYEKIDINIKANVTDFIPRYPLVKKVHLGLRKYNQKLFREEKNSVQKYLFNISEKIEECLFDFIVKTRIEDKSKIHETTRKELENFFNDEKEIIENISGRGLQNLWW